MPGFGGNRALVTGSTSGIGLGIARQVAADGCSVMLDGFGDPTAVERLRDTLERERGVTVRYDGSDLTRPDAVAALVDATVAALGGIDILVNNAGVQHTAPIDEFPPERWDAIIALNLSAVFHATRRALPHMKRGRWGRIVNTASAHGLVASPNKAAYVAAKHGVVGLTKVVALETAGSGITCNAICPGWTRTELIEPQIASRAAALGVGLEEGALAPLTAKPPSGPIVSVEPGGVPAAVPRSPEAAQITGAALPVDGGGDGPEGRGQRRSAPRPRAAAHPAGPPYPGA